MNKILKIAIAAVLTFSLGTVQAQDTDKQQSESSQQIKKGSLPEGMTQEQYDAISKQLPPGVTIEMILAKLPKGMTLQQALQMMAAQQKAKAAEAQAAAEAKKPQGAGGWKFMPYFALNLGMTSSIGTPRETRSVESSDYNFNFAVGVMVSKRFCNKWGVYTGLALERKGSNSNVIMKDYYTKVHFDGVEEETQGYFSGRSQGFHDVYYITAPVNIMYEPSKKWEAHFGPYFGYAISKDRHGISSEGTIRQSIYSPLIPVDHSETDNSKKVFDFDWGLQAGVTYALWRQLYCLFDFSWGFANVWDGTDYGMKKDIYNIYAKLGFGWKFETGKKKKK